MTFYDLSIPFYDDKNDDKNHQFSSNHGHGSANKIKRYAMPIIIKNTDSNKVCKDKKEICATIWILFNFVFKTRNQVYFSQIQKENKEYTTRFFLVDSISGVSSSTSTSFNEQPNEDSSENIGQSLRSKTNKDKLSQKDIEYPTIIRYLKRMAIK